MAQWPRMPLVCSSPASGVAGVGRVLARAHGAAAQPEHGGRVVAFNAAHQAPKKNGHPSFLGWPLFIHTRYRA